MRISNLTMMSFMYLYRYRLFCMLTHLNHHTQPNDVHCLCIQPIHIENSSPDSVMIKKLHSGFNTGFNCAGESGMRTMYKLMGGHVVMSII